MPQDFDDEMDMNETGSDMGRKAKDTARKVKQTGQELLSDAKDAVSGTVSDIKAEAGARVEDARQRIADQGEQMARSLHEATMNVDPNSLQAKMMEGVASGIESVSSTIREADMSRMVGSVQAFARRNPVLFATGAAIAGLVIARVMAGSMSSREDETYASSGRYGTSSDMPRTSGAGMNGAMGRQGAGMGRDTM